MEDSKKRPCFITLPVVTWSRLNQEEYKHVTPYLFNLDKIICFVPSSHNFRGEDINTTIVWLQDISLELEVEMPIAEIKDMIIGKEYV